MVNQTPVLNMVNNSGTVFNNRNTGRNTYNIQNIGNDINIKKTITGKYSYYLDDRNNLYKKFHNGSHKFIRNKVYDISMNDKALYIIDLRYNIEYVAHSKIKNRNWKHIPNKDNRDINPPSIIKRCVKYYATRRNLQQTYQVYYSRSHPANPA